jgi:hypothetical protein
MTDDQMKELVRIPDNIEPKKVLERLLISLSLEFPRIFTEDRIRSIIGKPYTDNYQK